VRQNSFYGRAADEEYFPPLVDFVTVVVTGASVVVVVEVVVPRVVQVTVFSIC